MKSISDKTCDGIFHCLYGEDEMFEICKDTFPKEATIQCIENRLPGTIDVTIMAIPCNGILECRDRSDEDCEEDKWILATIIASVFLITVCIYFFLIFERLTKWKKSVIKDFHGGIPNHEWSFSRCSEMKGNDLAKLKVCFHSPQRFLLFC